MNNRIISWFFYSFVLFFTAVLLFSLLQDINNKHWDKLAHFIGFLVLTLALKGFFKLPTGISCVCLCSYAMATEIGQYWLLERDGSVADFYADIAGIGLGLLLLKVFELFYNLKAKDPVND